MSLPLASIFRLFCKKGESVKIAKSITPNVSINFCIDFSLRACRRPSIFSPAESAPPPRVRDALFSLLQGADPLDPKASQGPHPHPNPPRDPRGPNGDPRGPKGTQGDPRA